MTSRLCGCAVVGDAQLVLECSRLLEVPLPLWCPGQQAAKLGMRERGVKRHVEPLGGGQAGPPRRPGPSRPAGKVQDEPLQELVPWLADGEDAREGVQRRTGLAGCLPGRG